MTQTPFKPFNAEEKFDPIQSSGEGLIKSAKENQDAFLASIVKRNADLFKYELEEATRKDQRLNKLAELSQTAAKVAKPILEAQTNEKYMEGAEAWYNASAKNQDILQAEFDAEEDIDIEEDTVHGNIVEKSYKDKQIDIFLKEELSNLSKRQQTGFLRAMYQDRAEQYPMFLQQNSTIPVQIQLPDGTFVERTLEEAKDPNEYRQIEQRLYRAYIRPFATHEQAGVNKYLYEKMREHNKAHYEQWYQKTKKVKEDRDEEKAVDTVLSSPELGKELEAFYNKYEKKYGGPQKVREFINGKIIEEMKAGNFTVDDLKELGDYEIESRDGRGKVKFKDLFKKDYDKLEDELILAIKSKADQLELDDAQDLENYIEARDKFETRAMDPDKPVSAAAIDEMQLTLRTLHPEGKESEKLKQIKKDLTIDARTLKKEKDKALELAKKSKLTTKVLREEFSYQIYTDGTLINIAQQQDQLFGNEKYKTHTKAIEALVAPYIRINPDKLDTASVLLIGQLKRDYNTYLEEYQDADQAFNQVVSDFNTKWNTEENKTNGTYNLSTLGVNPEGYEKRPEYLSTFIKLELGDLTKQGTVFTQEELEKLGSDPDKWSEVPIKAKLAAAIFGIDPIDVFNLQREAAGLDPIPKKGALEAAEAIAPDVKTLICRHNTHDRSSRCWGTTGKDNTEIIPEEKKEEIDEISQTNNIPFAKAAAFSDVTQTNPLIVDYSNIPDQYMTQFWSSVYKYSGGKDKEALTNLIRPTLANSYGDKTNT